jgi:hypothetical protein
MKHLNGRDRKLDDMLLALKCVGGSFLCLLFVSTNAVRPWLFAAYLITAVAAVEVGRRHFEGLVLAILDVTGLTLIGVPLAIVVAAVSSFCGGPQGFGQDSFSFYIDMMIWSVPVGFTVGGTVLAIKDVMLRKVAP